MHHLSSLCLVLLTVGSCPRAQSHTAAISGVTAPSGRWYTQGGCAARSGASRTRPIVRQPEVAWRFSVRGTIEGEPLVWDDRIVIAEDRGKGRRYLHVLRLSDGKPTFKARAFKTPVPLQPTLWRRTVVIRPAPTKLASFDYFGSSLAQRHTYFSKPSTRLHGPLLFGGELYCLSDEHLERIELGRQQPIWRTKGNFRGSIALRGDSLYLLEYRFGNPDITRVARDSGKVLQRVELGEHEGVTPGFPATGLVSLGTDIGIVRLSKPIKTYWLVKTPQGEQISTAGAMTFRCKPSQAGQSKLEPLHPVDCILDPLTWSGNWIAMAKDLKQRPFLLFHNGRGAAKGKSSQDFLLADEKNHPEFLEPRVAPTLAGGVVYLGARAFDAATHKILWRGKYHASVRAVPARETLLLVEDGKTLLALREHRGGGDHRPSTAPPEGEASGFAGRIVRRDGSMARGKFRLDAKAGVVFHGSSKKGTPLDEVLMLEDRNGRVVYWGKPQDALRAIELLIDAQIEKITLDLTRRARASNDIELIGRLLGRCRELSISAKQTRAVAKAHERLEHHPKKVNEKLSARLTTAEARITSDAVETIWPEVASLPERSPLRRMLLRMILQRAPKHPGAVASVRAMLPEGLRTTTPFAALQWLDYAEVTQAISIRFVKPQKEVRGDPTWEQRKLRVARKTWRDDLAAFESKRLLVITPLSTPVSIARCLSLGELVCQTLDSMFSGLPVKRQKTRRLRINLYADQEEYLREAEKSGFKKSHIKWTGGMFLAEESLSRLFIPKGDRDFALVMQVFAHELTHHWLQERCPAFADPEDDEKLGRLPGVWIVEGFASLIEDFVFDLEKRSYQSRNPHSDPLDTLAHCTGNQLVPWNKLFRLSNVERFAEMNTRELPSLAIPVTWYLGKARPFSQMGMFYAQSAATCQYLFNAENGRYRTKLIEYVVNHYSMNARAMDIERAFGLKRTELGRRVMAYARAGK